MANFARFFIRKFVTKSVQTQQYINWCSNFPSRKIHNNNFKDSLTVARISQQVDLAKNYKNNEKFRSTNDGNRTNGWFIASGVFLNLFNFWGEEKEEEKIPELIMSIKRSIWLIQKEEFKKAEQMLHIALRQAQAIQHYEGITYVYDVMANLAFEVGDYKKAETLFVSVMQRLISTGTPQDDIKIIHMSLKMAKLYQETGDLSKAEDGYQFCLKNIEPQAAKNPDNEDILVLWAMSLDWYGRMLLEQSKYRQALNCFEQAYHLCLRVHGREHEQTVVLLNDLGTISCLAGDYDRAINYLTSAAEIGKSLPEMVDLGSIHVNLGSTYLKKGLYDEAKRSCEAGRKIAKARSDAETINEAQGCLDSINKLMRS